MPTPDQIANGLAIFAANYLKRWLEGNFYDRLFRTGLGQKLQGLDAKARYGIEFGLNLLTVFFDRALAEDTALKRFVKEVGLDAAPEISKRLINHAKNPQEQELVHALLTMDQEHLVQLLSWLYEIESGRRKKMLKEISQLSVDELVKLAQKMGGKIITNDFNLNKVAELHGVKVLNINELANAVKSVV